jgi:hypothetical protein
MVVETRNKRWDLTGYCQSQVPKNGGVSTVSHRIDDSPVWTDLLRIKHIYLGGRKIQVKNGKKDPLLER